MEAKQVKTKQNKEVVISSHIFSMKTEIYNNLSVTIK